MAKTKAELEQEITNLGITLQTTAAKLKALEITKGDLKTAINAKGGGLVDEPFREYVESIEGLTCGVDDALRLAGYDYMLSEYPTVINASKAITDTLTTISEYNNQKDIVAIKEGVDLSTIGNATLQNCVSLLRIPNWLEFKVTGDFRWLLNNTFSLRGDVTINCVNCTTYRYACYYSSIDKVYLNNIPDNYLDMSYSFGHTSNLHEIITTSPIKASKLLNCCYESGMIISPDIDTSQVIDANGFLRSANYLTTMKDYDWSSLASVTYMYVNYRLEYINKAIFPIATQIYNSFSLANCHTINEFAIPNVTSILGTINLPKLVEMRVVGVNGNPPIIQCNFDLNLSPLLSQETILSIAYALDNSMHTLTLSTAQAITDKLNVNCKLNTTNDGLVTCLDTDPDTLGTVEEYIINKGWTILRK